MSQISGAYQQDEQLAQVASLGLGVDRSVEMEHLNGMPWWKADVPRHWHRCWAQTRGWTNYFTRVERCACGAIRIDSRRWTQRNERRSK